MQGHKEWQYCQKEFVVVLYRVLRITVVFHGLLIQMKDEKWKMLFSDQFQLKKIVLQYRIRMLLERIMILYNVNGYVSNAPYFQAITAS